MTTVDLAGALEPADRRWATRHQDEPSDPDRLAALTSAARELLNNSTAEVRDHLTRLLDVVLDECDPSTDLGEQTEQALAQLRRVRDYLEQAQDGAGMTTQAIAPLLDEDGRCRRTTCSPSSAPTAVATAAQRSSRSVWRPLLNNSAPLAHSSPWPLFQNSITGGRP